MQKVLFLFLIIVSLLSTNDVDAFESSNLHSWNQMLPFPFHWNSDGAYSCTETNMTPVPGVNLHITDPMKSIEKFQKSSLGRI